MTMNTTPLLKRQDLQDIDLQSSRRCLLLASLPWPRVGGGIAYLESIHDMKEWVPYRFDTENGNVKAE